MFYVPNFFFSWGASSFKTTGKVHVFTIGYFLLGFIFFVRLKNWYWTICWISDIFLLVLQRVRKNFILDQTEIIDCWLLGHQPISPGTELALNQEETCHLYTRWHEAIVETKVTSEGNVMQCQQFYSMTGTVIYSQHDNIVEKKYELRNKNLKIIIIISRWDHASEQFLSGFPMNIPLTQTKK